MHNEPRLTPRTGRGIRFGASLAGSIAMHIPPREIKELEENILGNGVALMVLDPDAWLRIQTILNRATQEGVIVNREEAAEIRQMQLRIVR
jgi:hypothetical protein